MPAYDELANGATRVESGTGEEVNALVNQILASAIGVRRTMAWGGDEVLHRLLAGTSTALPMGNGPTSVAAPGGLSDMAQATLRAIGGQDGLSSGKLPGVGTLVNDEGLSLPLRGVTGLIGGLLRLFRGASPGEGSEATLAQPFEFPTARNSSLALGPDRYASYGMDYRYDGQPRRIVTNEAAERRVEIHIQALDARSILDRKEELAEAVRQAMSSAGARQEALLGY